MYYNYTLLLCKYVSTGNRSLLRNLELPTKMDVLTDDGTKRNFGYVSHNC